LEKSLDRKQAYDSRRWFSKEAWKKLKLGARIVFSRSIESKTNRVLAAVNTSSLEDFTDKMRKRLEDINRLDPGTKLKIRAQKNQQNIMASIQKAIESQESILEKKYAAEIKEVETTYPAQNEINKLKKKFARKISDKAEILNAGLQTTAAENSAFKLLKTLDEKKANELVEKAVTADKLMEELLKEMNIDANSEKGKALLALFQKPQEKKEEKETKAKEENAEQEQEQETAQQPQNIEEKENEQSVEDKKIEVSRAQGNEGETISSDGNPWVHNAEENTFTVSSDELTAEEIAALVSAIKEQSKDESFTLDVEKFSEAELEAFKQAAKEQKLKILDKEGKEISLEKDEKQEIVVEREQTPNKAMQEEKQEDRTPESANETEVTETRAEEKSDESPEAKKGSQESENAEHAEEESANDLSAALMNSARTRKDYELFCRSAEWSI